MRKKRFRLKGRLLLLSVLTTVIIFILFNTIVFFILRKLSSEQARELSSAYARQYAISGKNQFDYDMGLAKGLANMLQYKGDLDDAHRDSIYTGMMLEMLNMNPEFISVWASFELKYYQKGFNKDYGRKLIAAVRHNNTTSIDTYFRDMDTPNEGSDYFKIKADNIPVLTEPYIDSELGEFLITSLIYPIHIDGEFAGVGGIDIRLSALQDIIKRMDLMEGTMAMIMSNEGVLLSHTNDKFVGDTIKNVYPELDRSYNLINRIKNDNESVTFLQKTEKGNYFSTLLPFKVEETAAPWGVMISIPESIVIERFHEIKQRFILLSALGLLFILGVLMSISLTIEKTLLKVSKTIQSLARGNFKVRVDFAENSEGKIKELGNSVNILIQNLQKTVAFASEIEKGNLDTKFEAMSNDDELGIALVNMQQSLLKSKAQNEITQKQESINSWISDGLAKFANMLQKDNKDFKEFIRNITSEIVQYTQTGIGAIYLVNDDNENEKYIELAGSYGYNTEKKHIELQEGMIGTCIMEGEQKIFNKVPDNYIKISSSLGSGKPCSLIIMPLKTKDEVLGALELASFKPFEIHHIQFIEKLAESMAVTLSSIKMQNKTNALLEESKANSEEMKAQEETMRQVMEEMMVQQQEVELKEEKLKKILDELEVQEKEMKKRIEKIKKF